MTKSNLILKPNPNDVLFGRGGPSYRHSGNLRFRQLIEENRDAYTDAIDSEERKEIFQQIVEIIKNMVPSGRFLHYDQTTGSWYKATCSDINQKISQSFRNKARVVKDPTNSFVRKPSNHKAFAGSARGSIIRKDFSSRLNTNVNSRSSEMDQENQSVPSLVHLNKNDSEGSRINSSEKKNHALELNQQGLSIKSRKKLEALLAFSEQTAIFPPSDTKP